MFFAPAIRTRGFAPRAWDGSVERFINDVFAAPAQRARRLEEDDRQWTLSLDVPGLTREELAVSIEGCVVRIESKPEAKRQIRAAYELPLEVDSAASRAKLENGVLTLALGKKLPQSKASVLAID